MQYMPSLAFQAVCFMYSAGLGFTLGIIYDLIRMLFYLLTGSDKKLTVVRDIIYSIVCLVATFLFLLVMCDGQLIAYVFVAEGIGTYVYFYSLSDSVFLPAKKTINAFKRLFLRVKSFFYLRKTKFLFFMQKIFQKLHKITKKHLHIRHTIVYNFFVNLCPKKLFLKNRGDDDGKREKTET